MNNALMFSSQSDEWSTPQDTFDAYHSEFGFSFDLAASIENRKLDRYYGLDHVDPTRRNGLIPSVNEPGWGWCNPPYSRGLQKQFIAVCARRRLMVMLLPARTDTQAFHAFIWNTNLYLPRTGVEVRFMKGRLKFGGCKDAAPFPSMIVVFRP